MKKNYFTTTFMSFLSFSTKNERSPFKNRLTYSFLFFVTMLMIGNSSWAQTPTITSFTPTSGASGTVVTVTGTNFNATASNNIVKFGATKATVSSASTTSLTVTVPAGATYEPVTVLNTATALTGASLQFFLPTFSPNKFDLTINDILPKVDFTTTGTQQPYYVAIGDLDGDGKPDLVVANFANATISVFRNTSSSGSITNASFAARVDFATGANPISIAIGDLNGDGKPELAVTNNGGASVSVFRNTASSGAITTASFATKVDFTTGTNPRSVAIGDLDGNGKADLAIANTTDATVSIFPNTFTSSAIAFAAKVDYATGAAPHFVAIGDLDGDGKPDLATANNGSASVSVLRNNFTTAGTISFGTKVDFTAGTSPVSLAIGDLDNDGKRELVVANFSSANLSVLKNTATSGTITTASFATKVDFTAGTGAWSVAICDLDGDGKPDLAVANGGVASVSILRNTTSASSITAGSFAAKVDFATATATRAVAIGDLDLDGKPDLVAANYLTATISIFRNNPTFSITYNGNTNTSGTVPAISNTSIGTLATVSANTGNLTRTGYTFAGWNTSADGTGLSIAASGSATFINNNHITLFAQWCSIAAPTIPTFRGVAPICPGQFLNTLDTTSTNGISGTWSPALDNTTTTTYTFTPSAGQCATTTTLTITVYPRAPNVTLATAINVTDLNYTTTGNNFVSNCYTNSGGVDEPVVWYKVNLAPCVATISLNTCSGTNFNTVLGVYAPDGTTLLARNNDFCGVQSSINDLRVSAYSFVYVIVEGSNGAQGNYGLSISQTLNITPTFAAVAPICSGEALSALPTTSTNGISGTWSPAVDNTTTTTYTFTPTDGQCATTLTITVNPSPPGRTLATAIDVTGLNYTTTGNNIPTNCYINTVGNASPDVWYKVNIAPCVATISLNTCSGTDFDFDTVLSVYAPNGTTLLRTDDDGCGPQSSINNLNVSAYSFVYVIVEGYSTRSGNFGLSISQTSVNITPTFAAVAPICPGGALSALPTTSTNGISGTWSPALDNTTTTTYTFTPTAGQCATTTTTLTITVNPSPPGLTLATAIEVTGLNYTTTGNNLASNCYIDTIGDPLPYVWYKVNLASCARISLNTCSGTDFDTVLGVYAPNITELASNNNFCGGASQINNLNVAAYSFVYVIVGGYNLAQGNYGLSISQTVVTTPTFAAVAPICSGVALSALPTTSNDGITGTWSPALNNTTTTTYTFTPTAGQCTSTTTTLTITVNPNPSSGATLATAIEVTGLNYTTTGNNFASNCYRNTVGDTAPDVWYKVNLAPCVATLSLNTCTGTNFDTILRVHAPDGTTLLARNNNFCGVQSSINNLNVSAYSFVYVIVEGSNGRQGNYGLSISQTVNNIAPTFTAVAPICPGATLSALPTTSNNGITGTWSPALNNAATTTYTFTPTAGLCATPATMTTIVNTTTWNGTSWSNGLPDASKGAIISGNYSAAANIEACSLEVTGTAIVSVPTGFNVTVSGQVTVATTASLTFENNANLIQTTDVVNSGNITSKRDSNLLKRLDYTLWSSPVSGSQTLSQFSPLTSAATPVRFYTYNPTTNLYNSTIVGNPFATATGYLIRMPNEKPGSLGFTTPYYLGNETLIYTGVFKGTPNNGMIDLNGLYSDKFYAVGNPYPSTLSANAFLSGNATAGTLYFWRKTNGASGSAYSTYTASLGGAAGASGIAPNGTIQVGQGFIVKTGLAATSLRFSNAMRTNNNASQFLKTTKAVDKSRLWLDLSDATGRMNQVLIGYLDGATVGFDAGIDGKYFNDSKIALTSIVEAEEYVIQGRPTFDVNDVVALGFKTDVAGNYSIALNSFDGVFDSGQEVYLVDAVAGQESDLKKESYSFTAVAGLDNDRFSLKYQKNLKVDAPVFNENTVTVYENNGFITVNSSSIAIKTVHVYDVRGRLIAQQKNVNDTKASFNNLRTAKQVLIVKVIGSDNTVVSKKVLH